MTYENGVIFALFLQLIRSVKLYFVCHSQFSKNLRKIYYRVRWSNGSPVILEQDELNPSTNKTLTKIFLWVLLNLILILFSWLWVFYSILVDVIYFKNNLIGVPEQIKLFKWKINNLDLSSDEILHYWYEIYPKSHKTFSAYKKAYLEELKFRELI